MRSPEVYWVLGSLLIVLCAASVVGFALKRRHPASPQIANLNARIRAWWVLVLVGGGALLAGPAFLIALFALMSLAALREFVTDTSVLIFCYLMVPVQYWLIATDWYAHYSPLVDVAILVIAGLSTRWVRWKSREAVAGWGVILCVVCISHVPALMYLRVPGYEGRAPLLMLFMVLIAQVSDVLQYIWGKLAGKHAIAPSISPSKTVEGLVGAMASTTVLGALLSPITPFSAWQAGWMALLITGLGFLGGLVMSAIKRGRGIKDWGSLIAGHGGMLDRIDSLCFSAPVFYHVTRYFFG